MDRFLRMCLNWKVLVGMAVVGLGIWALAPDLLVRAIPLLILAVCPLSMVVMMRGMQAKDEARPHQEPGFSARGGADRIAELKEQLVSIKDQQDAAVREIERLQRRAVGQEGIDAQAEEREQPAR